MRSARKIVISRKRIANLIVKFLDKSYRDSYVRTHTRQFLAAQIRAFRGERSQTEFAKVLGVSQSVVSERLEDPNYGKWNLQTLFDTAAKLNVAVFIRFVDFETFLELTSDDSDEALSPSGYRAEALEKWRALMDRPQNARAEVEFWKEAPKPGQQSTSTASSEAESKGVIRLQFYESEEKLAQANDLKVA
jgi:hypothetical protein